MDTNRNQILERVYALYPTIAAWAKSGRASPLWSDPQNAKHGMSQYLGPQAQVLYMDSLHIAEPDRAFLRSPEAFAVMCEVVDAIYHLGCPQCPHIVDGFFVEKDKGNVVPA